MLPARHCNCKTDLLSDFVVPTHVRDAPEKAGNDTNEGTICNIPIETPVASRLTLVHAGIGEFPFTRTSEKFSERSL